MARLASLRYTETEKGGEVSLRHSSWLDKYAPLCIDLSKNRFTFPFFRLLSNFDWWAPFRILDTVVRFNRSKRGGENAHAGRVRAVSVVVSSQRARGSDAARSEGSTAGTDAVQTRIPSHGRPRQGESRQIHLWYACSLQCIW